MSERKMRTCRGGRGFTIMELLVVMSIMGALTAIGVTSYFSAISGMTRRSAVQHFVAALKQAHQLASVQSSKIGVIWYNESKDGSTTNIVPTYVICKAIGHFTYVKDGSPQLYDEFTPLADMYGVVEDTAVDYSKFKGFRIYNMSPDADGYSDVLPRVKKSGGLTLCKLSSKGLPYYELIQGNAGVGPPAIAYPQVWPYGFQVKEKFNSTWQTGDPYGIAVSEVFMLPKNIVFSALGKQETTSDTQNRSVWFYPDGHCDSCSVTLKDTQQNKSCIITVGKDGNVTYEKW